MKKVIIFVLVIGSVCFLYLKTKSFTYLNGEFRNDFTLLLNLFFAILAISSFLYLFFQVIKNWVYKIKITPFKDF